MTKSTLPPEITVNPAELGPAMRLLNERQREFVMWLVRTGSDNETEAARQAGYMFTSEGALKVQACRMAHDPKILAAIREECERDLKFGLPRLVGEMRGIAFNATHRQQRQALTTLMNIGGLREASETVHTVALDPENLKAQISSMLRALRGVDLTALLPAPTAVDAAFEEVPREPGKV